MDEKEIDQNTSGQRGNKFNNSYRDISVIVTENNSVVMPKYQQYSSLNKMLSNFSKVLMAHISFTAVINNGGIGKGIGSIRKGTVLYSIYVYINSASLPFMIRCMITSGNGDDTC